MNLGVLGAAVFDEAGLAGSSGLRRPGSRPDAPPRWREVSDAPFTSYRRLPGFSKGLCLTAEAAGARALKGGDRVATILGTGWGCLDADVAFQASLAPEAEVKPALFPYTLPSTCLGELGILYGLRGPSLCLSVEPGDERSALREGAGMIQAGDADQALVCYGEWLGVAAGAAAGAPAQARFCVVLLGEGSGSSPALTTLASLLDAERPSGLLAELLRGAS